MALLSSMRATRIWRRVQPATVRSFLSACIVAATYDLARALALVITVPHRHAGVRRLATEERA
jgi:hypothetical protein